MEKKKKIIKIVLIVSIVLFLIILIIANKVAEKKKIEDEKENYYANKIYNSIEDFKTVEEKINELYTRLVMETDKNKILYITQQIINLVPDKESFMKTLFSKLKG